MKLDSPSCSECGWDRIVREGVDTECLSEIEEVGSLGDRFQPFPIRMRAARQSEEGTLVVDDGVADVSPEKVAQASAFDRTHTKKLEAAPPTRHPHYARFGNQDWVRQFSSKGQRGTDLQGGVLWTRHPVSDTSAKSPVPALPQRCRPENRNESETGIRYVRR